jgi:hypothetical protein
MEYFLTKAAGESTKILLFTSQISDIEARKYPMDILCIQFKELCVKLTKHLQSKSNRQLIIFLIVIFQLQFQCPIIKEKTNFNDYILSITIPSRTGNKGKKPNNLDSKE